jgi:hypothetical protein
MSLAAMMVLPRPFLKSPDLFRNQPSDHHVALHCTDVEGGGQAGSGGPIAQSVHVATYMRV